MCISQGLFSPKICPQDTLQKSVIYEEWRASTRDIVGTINPDSGNTAREVRFL